ncbi:hypothetical protein GCM10009737_00710 [Nocardioides lentus]|uniref:Uncharacterized protein n=1 Tax=Nocardioides lentus TaxID=338077 RepID=A0ABN2NVY4_9ACTN
MEFFLSPGFGGAAAVVAALIAYAAARSRARIDRRLGERSQWWARAEWALDLTRDADPYSQLMGWNALTTLVNSAPTDEDAELIAGAAEAAEADYLELAGTTDGDTEVEADDDVDDEERG